MSCLNYAFFDEFKLLDNLCRDIYGDSVDKKLGVTLYIEDMDSNNYSGTIKVSGWDADYRSLKRVRNIRNELAHSRNSISVDICSQEDIDFLRSFRSRILNQTDPISLLRKRNTQQRSHSSSQPNYTYMVKKKKTAGCFLGVLASLLVVVACVMIVLA